MSKHIFIPLVVISSMLLGIVIGLFNSNNEIFFWTIVISIGAILILTFRPLIKRLFLGDPLVIFSPLITFPLAYFIYFLMGTTGLLGFVRDPSQFELRNVIPLAGSGLIGYFVGQVLVDLIPRSKTRKRGELKRGFAQIGLLLIVVSLITVVVIYKAYGLFPLFNLGSRQHVIGGYLVYLYNLMWIGSIMVIAYEIRAGYYWGWIKGGIVFVVSSISMLLFAFRTPIVIMAMTLGFYLFLTRKIKLSMIALGTVIIIVFSIFFGTYRFIGTYGDVSMSKLMQSLGLGMDTISIGLGMLYFSFFRTSINTLSTIIQKVPSVYNYYYGMAGLSSFLSMLPGHQLSARDITAFLVTGMAQPSTSLTATIIGIPYIDFGALGVFIFMVVCGFIIRWYFERSKNGNKVDLLMFSYITCILVLSIHTGLSDPLIMIIAPFIFLCSAKITSG